MLHETHTTYFQIEHFFMRKLGWFPTFSSCTLSFRHDIKLLIIHIDLQKYHMQNTQSHWHPPNIPYNNYLLIVWSKWNFKCDSHFNFCESKCHLKWACLTGNIHSTCSCWIDTDLRKCLMSMFFFIPLPRTMQHPRGHASASATCGGRSLSSGSRRKAWLL